MRFGTTRQLKAAQAARVAILAAVLESSAFACVGGTVLDNTAVTLPCLTKQAGILQLAQAAATPCPPCVATDAHQPHAHQTWIDALRRIAATLPNGSRLLLCSDFHWLTADDAPLFAHLALRHDVACVHITDPIEHALPALGRASFYDIATQRLRWVDTGKREVRERFAQAASARHKEIENRVRHIDIAYFALSTGSDPLQLFLEGMDD